MQSKTAQLLDAVRWFANEYGTARESELVAGVAENPLVRLSARRARWLLYEAASDSLVAKIGTGPGSGYVLTPKGAKELAITSDRKRRSSTKRSHTP